jgi:uncharacterized protein DUF4129
MSTVTRELTLSQYIAELQLASNVLDQRSGPEGPLLRARLPGEWVVRTEAGSFHVKTDWLAAALAADKDPSSARNRSLQAQQHLAALLEEAQALASPAASPDLAQSRARVDRILKGAEFQGSHEPSWWDNFRARLNRWISRQLNRIFGRVAISDTVGSGIAWVLIGTAVLVVAFWTVRRLMNAASRSEMDLRGSSPAGQDWRYWSEQGRIAAERGDYRAAIHGAYWAAVARLEEGRILPEDSARTPRESLHVVEQVSGAYTPLMHLTRKFEIIWYGYRMATADDWNDAMQQLEMLGCPRSSTVATAV